MLGAAGFEQGPVFVATCLIAAFGSIFMGLLANLPVEAVDLGLLPDRRDRYGHSRGYRD